jgi:hypothetical protein
VATVKHVAQQYVLNRKTVKEIDKRYLKREFGPVDLSNIRLLAMDDPWWDGCFRWTDSQLTLGCDSVSGVVLHGLLSLRDPVAMVPGPPAILSHPTPADVACYLLSRSFGSIRKPPRTK